MVKGEIFEILEDGTVVIHARFPINELVHKQVREVYVEAIDARPLSDKQRRACYALIGAIADWSGSSVDEVKEAFKLEFWAERVDTLADKIFSLSDAPMSLICEFQRFLVDFILREDVPLSFSLRDYADDIMDYTYMCLLNKKCTVCGRRGELHHLNAVGMGNDRQRISHIGRLAMCLCRIHHDEIHAAGEKDFMEKYHLNGGVPIDRAIARKYGLGK